MKKPDNGNEEEKKINKPETIGNIEEDANIEVNNRSTMHLSFIDTVDNASLHCYAENVINIYQRLGIGQSDLKTECEKFLEKYIGIANSFADAFVENNSMLGCNNTVDFDDFDDNFDDEWDDEDD